ncbi:MAG: hypothetical protein F6Q13_18305, partial [Mycobacterium sp.]
MAVAALVGTARSATVVTVTLGAGLPVVAAPLVALVIALATAVTGGRALSVRWIATALLRIAALVGVAARAGLPGWVAALVGVAARAGLPGWVTALVGIAARLRRRVRRTRILVTTTHFVVRGPVAIIVIIVGGLSL